MEQFIVSARKYRPLTFSTVVGQSAISQTLKNAIERKQLAHAYLFCGPRGVGKTTCARIFAKTINCLAPDNNGDACGQCESCKAFAENRSYNIHELDAASNNSVEDIRLLTEKVRILPQIGKYSIYIIDEVHMLSSAAFNAFLKTLEEPPAHAIFILATTEKHKIIPTILSRCQIYDFNRIRVDDMVKHLESISKSENVIAEPEALHIIAQKADGSMRDALSIFDQVVAYCGNKITYAKVIENLNVLDYEYYFKLTDAFLCGDYCSALIIFDTILAKGFDAQHFIRGLNSHFRDLLVCKDTRTSQLLEVGASIAESYLKQSEKCTVNFLFEALSIANSCDVGYKTSSNQRLHVELSLCKLSSITTEKFTGKEIAIKQPQKTTEINEEITEIKKTSEIPEKNAKKIEINPIEADTHSDISSSTKSMSIKGFDKINEKIEIPSSQQNLHIQEMSEEYSNHQIENAWMEYAIKAEKNKKGRLASMMKQTKLQIDNDQISFSVLNSLQKTYIEQGVGRDILNFIQKKVKNSNLKLNIIIDEHGANVETPKLYTDSEKEKYMQEKNAELINLQSRLELYS